MYLGSEQMQQIKLPGVISTRCHLHNRPGDTDPDHKLFLCTPKLVGSHLAERN